MKCLFGFLGLLLFCSVQAESIGTVSVVSGEVSWARNGAPVLLQRGDALSTGDVVVTGSAGRVVLRMNDGSAITLGADTELRIAEWRYISGADDNSALFELTEGVFRFITGLITRQQNPDLMVRTPAATIGIRGTDFWGGYLDPDALDVLLIEGEHALEIRNEQGAVLIRDAGFGVTVSGDAAPAAPIRWGDAKLNRALESVALPSQAG